MKKTIMIIILFILFPFVSHAETCDPSKIKIESIEWVEKTDNIKGYDDVIVKDKEINLNLTMTEIGDKIKYKIIVKNESNDDFELDKTGIDLKSDYIKYSFETENGDMVVKGNSTEIVYLTIEYKDEIPDNEFDTGIYDTNHKFIINLSNDMVKNPKTYVGNIIIVLFLILFISILFLIIFRNKKASALFCIIGLLFVIPLYVYALCSTQIMINSKIRIEKKYKVYYIVSEFLKDDEKNQYIMDYATEEGAFYGHVYVGDESSATKYIFYNFLIKEEGSYNPGEKLEVKDFVRRDRLFYLPNDSCTFSEKYNADLCDTDEHAFEYNRYYYFGYGGIIQKYFGLSDTLEDLLEMEFNPADYSIEDFNNINHIAVESGTSFTMPAHDVYFDMTVPEYGDGGIV